MVVEEARGRGMSLPDFQLGVRGEEALVVCWAALGFFAYSLGVLVCESGDGEIVGVTNGVEGWSVSWYMLATRILKLAMGTYQSSSCVVVKCKVKK